MFLPKLSSFAGLYGAASDTVVFAVDRSSEDTSDCTVAAAVGARALNVPRYAAFDGVAADVLSKGADMAAADAEYLMVFSVVAYSIQSLPGTCWPHCLVDSPAAAAVVRVVLVAH